MFIYRIFGVQRSSKKAPRQAEDVRFWKSAFKKSEMCDPLWHNYELPSNFENLRFSVHWKGNCLTSLVVSNLNTSVAENQKCKKTKLDCDMHFNDALTSNAVYWKRPFGVDPSFYHTWVDFTKLVVTYD